jgi:hypothetical protein
MKGGRDQLILTEFRELQWLAKDLWKAVYCYRSQTSIQLSIAASFDLGFQYI